MTGPRATGFRGYPASWITASASRGIGKLGTDAPRAPLEVHVDLSAGIVAPWHSGKVRTVLQWILKHDGHLTRLDCVLDDRNSCVPLSTIRQALEAGQCVTRADRMQRISSRSIHQDTPSGETIYVGSPQSQTLLRVYDKLLESQAKQREDWQDYGIRFDLARLLLATENMEPAIRIERTTCGLRRLEPDDCSAAESPPQSSKSDDKPRG